MSNFLFMARAIKDGVIQLIPYAVIALPISAIITKKIFDRIEKDLRSNS